jgi:hypothetical protein
VLVIATEWPLYREIVAERLREDLTVLDPNRFVPKIGVAVGIRYVAVGTPNRTGL